MNARTPTTQTRHRPRPYRTAAARTPSVRRAAVAAQPFSWIAGVGLAAGLLAVGCVSSGARPASIPRQNAESSVAAAALLAPAEDAESTATADDSADANDAASGADVTPAIIPADSDAGTGDAADAQPVAEPPPTNARRLIEEGETLAAEGAPADARVVLSKALLEPDLTLVDERRALDTLNELNRELLASTEPGGDCTLVTVRSGDTLSHIAQRHRTTWEAICKLNGLSDANAIRVGQQLRVLNGRPHLIVWRAKAALDLWIDDHFIKRYTVALGDAGHPTPAGEFSIDVKVKDPGWGRYAGGEPDNPIGTRWLGLAENEYGIHGTPASGTISASTTTQGSIRMASHDIEELFDIATSGTTVSVR